MQELAWSQCAHKHPVEVLAAVMANQMQQWLICMIITCLCDTGVIVTVVCMGEQGGTKQSSVRREMAENQFERFKYMLRLIENMLADSLILECIRMAKLAYLHKPKSQIRGQQLRGAQYEVTDKKQRRTKGSFCPANKGRK